MRRASDVSTRARLPLYTPQFGLPNSTIGNPNAGIMTSTVGNPRQMQMGLRLSF